MERLSAKPLPQPQDAAPDLLPSLQQENGILRREVLLYRHINADKDRLILSLREQLAESLKPSHLRPLPRDRDKSRQALRPRGNKENSVML
jgi:hypothetical protein